MRWIELYVNDKPMEQYDLRGNYIFGRNRIKCKLFSFVLNKPISSIIIPSSSVSGFHGVLCFIAGKYQIVDGWADVYSTNGIFVNQKKVKFAILQDRNEVLLGSKDIRFVYREVLSGELNSEEEPTVQTLFEI